MQRALARLSYASGDVHLCRSSWGPMALNRSADHSGWHLQCEIAFVYRPGDLAVSLASRSPRICETATYCFVGRQHVTKDGIKVN